MHRGSRPSTIVLGSAAIFAALLFSWPGTTTATVIPKKVLLQSGDLVTVVEGDELIGWYAFTTDIVFRRDTHAEITTPSACPFPALNCEAFVSRHWREHIALERLPRVQDGQIRTFLENARDMVDREPENARLTMQDGTLVVLRDGIPGRSLSIEATAADMVKKLENNRVSTVVIGLVTNEVSPKVSASTVKALGIHELVSQGKTNFQGSPKNRIFNIKRALEQFDGALIEPGAEFSFVDLLGEVDGEHGYLPELVIKHNRTEPEFGGGICQVSTTMFRAALNAGMKVTMRKNHAYPVQYYKPYGMDATIYIPRPDLRFINNTPGHILILPTVEGTELTFSFYGTRDGRTVTIDGPHILEKNPDGSMKTAFTQAVTDATGTVIIQDAFPSNYKSPSLFPHPGEDPVYTEKPRGWSSRQWKEYKKLHPEIR